MAVEYFGIIITSYILSGIIFGIMSCACCSNKNNINSVLGFLLGFLLGVLGFAITVTIVLSGIDNNFAKNHDKNINSKSEDKDIDQKKANKNICKKCGYPLVDDKECPHCYYKRN